MGIETTLTFTTHDVQFTLQENHPVSIKGKRLPSKKVVIEALYERNLLTPQQWQEMLGSGTIPSSSAPGNRTQTDAAHLIAYFARGGNLPAAQQLLKSTYIQARNGQYK